MRVFTAALATETNTFAPIPTDMRSFVEGGLYAPGAHPEGPTLVTSPLWVLRRRAAQDPDLDVIEGTCAWAEPAGTIARATYEELRDRILAELEAAMPVDAVALGLHGAMVAHGYDDCEGDLLSRVRALVGPDVPIGAELDPHCHMTELMVESADLLICFKEFPHTDFVERAEEVVELTLRLARGEIRPRLALYDCRMIAWLPTSREPMRSFVDDIMAGEGKDGILSISIVHGFAFGDVPGFGTKVLVVTDDRPGDGADLAEQLGQKLYGLRGKTTPPVLGVDEGIDRALAIEGGPVVVADPCDNPGGGAPSDATQVLRRLIERDVRDAALGPIWDPIAAQFCVAAGEGSTLQLRFAGKTGPSSGDPIDAEVEILRVVQGATQTFGRSVIGMGDCVAIRIGGVEIVLTSRRRQALGNDLFGNVGIDLARKKIVVVKSTNHFYASFAPIAKEVLYLDSEGPLPRDLATLNFRNIERPKWPFDQAPFG
ncbi:MAG: M81 family metallopeptidase [Pseudomonadota bacterium]